MSTSRLQAARLWSFIVPAIAMVLVVLSGAGCGFTGHTQNPAFPVTADAAREELRVMREAPVRPARPVVVIGGLFDVGIVADDLAARIERHTSPSADIIVVSPFGTSTVEESRRKVIARLEARFPSDDPDHTVEVDVVGFSLGGVVAAYAALGPDQRAAAVDASEADAARSMKRLNVVRLFAISVPFSGSGAAAPPTLDERVVAIRRGSTVLKAISDDRAAQRGLMKAGAIAPGAGSDDRATGSAADFHDRLFAYSRLQDNIVSPELAALPGEHPFWVSNLPLELAHAHAYKDPRILADICRRLRNEPGYTRFPPVPVPLRGPESDSVVSERFEASDRTSEQVGHGSDPASSRSPVTPARGRTPSTGTWGD